VTAEQIAVFAILGGGLVLFVWGRWRYDVVAVTCLMAAVLSGVVPAGEAFLGFGHPAVITVAAVLALSRALTRSGLVDLIADRLFRLAAHPRAAQMSLWGMGAAFSAFMNNVGALTLLMPVALSAGRKHGTTASRALMPLSFATILGGLVTLIGTPPNVVVANFRRDAGGAPFGMFDFTPVGLAVAGAGLVYLMVVGWRLIPQHRKGTADTDELFEVANYVSELRAPEGAQAVGRPVAEFEKGTEEALAVIGIIRGGRRLVQRLRAEAIRVDDVLLVQGSPTALKEATDKMGVELMGSEKLAEDLKEVDTAVIEAVVAPQGRIVGATPISLRLRSQYGVNLLAVAREGRPFMARLGNVRLRPGDVLLLEGDADTVSAVVGSLGCLPLAGRGLSFQPRRMVLPTAVFAAAVTATAVGVLPAALSLGLAVLFLVMAEVLPLRDLYEAIDWPILVLLGALIPVGTALQTTGGAAVIADWVVTAGTGIGPVWILAALLVVTMGLTDLMNNAATAVVMSPIAIDIAARLGTSADPFLMAVAVGASCAFLTPIGHQNNTLVMGPGGYRFTDYWRVGLPLDAIIVLVAVPLIPVVWPF
jgi:di/tricarboxylate transporter